MRTLIISALCGFSLALASLSPAAAQSTSANDPSASSSQSLSQNLSLLALPMFPSHAQSGAANVNNDNASSSANGLLKDKVLAQLRQQLETHSQGLSSACAHILIYVPPVTDTKMIIKVPGSDKVPENNQDGHVVPDLRAVPSVGVCGEDLRRVDAPHQAPPSSPDAKPALIPVHQAPIPH